MRHPRLNSRAPHHLDWSICVFVTAQKGPRSTWAENKDKSLQLSIHVAWHAGKPSICGNLRPLCKRITGLDCDLFP